MILRRIARRQAIAGSFGQLSQQGSLSSCGLQRRALHSVPGLGDSRNSLGEYFHEHGVPGFLTRTTFRRTWTEYQQELVDKLNYETTATEHEGNSALHLHKIFSRQPERAHIYNMAAMAAFNHFWWDSLSITKTEPSDEMLGDVNEWFSSLSELRQEMLEHGEAIFGNGFVWLMQERTAGTNTGGRLRILCTYNAGSPYRDAWLLRQNRDRATNLDPASPEAVQSRNSLLGRTPGSASLARNQEHSLQDQLDAEPLLCLNVWQHMWVPDYGLLERGKRAYLAAWWERINWDKVQQRKEAIRQSSTGRSSGRGLNDVIRGGMRY
ncbi:hypothetical protein LTS08_006830 [Lithohypha guttulata]|uniref:Manganese/iron superoxide dismutase C-terminal domain-containing protein n=1 Tax=Lithohypha guttulata TaxID=1690604 RepID=A0AAN7T4P7_9EURO|nr:hypothetical protein LTR51_001884 [Lithohypha guttulata]KAK5090384.1 hypothetical protein LTR05_000556 [Lithohypha guttulata]KAK5097418.1 hypothetical protein LTS08_006830 [Lithohypha guttulata]